MTERPDAEEAVGWHRLLLMMVAMLTIAASIVVVRSDTAEAVVIRPFAPRFTTNTNGAIDIFGNSQVTCPATVGTCASTQAGTTVLNNNSFAMVAIDVDGNASTSNSTMSPVTFPAGSIVRFAGLYWGACGPGAGQDQAKLRLPNAAGYTNITASQVDVANGTYQSFADVTSLVASAGSGDYWFADMRVCTGGGAHSGWSLVVAWEHPSQPMRNLTVFDGYGQVTTASAADRTINVGVSGFLTPPAGPVNVEVGVVSYEGDGGTVGDGLFLDTTPDGNLTLNATDGVALANPTPAGTNPTGACTPVTQNACNAFNSTITDQGTISTGGNPSHRNSLGFDIDEISANGILPNSSTSMELTMTTAGDFYYPGVVTTAVDLYAPAFPTTTKTVTDLNGGSTVPGDILEYSMTLTNIGQDPAAQSVITDPIPTGTTYVAGSLAYTGGPNLGAKTDGAGDDQAEFDAAASSLRFRIGTGATSTSGGTVGINESQTVRFRVRVEDAAAGTTVTNRYRFDYVAQTIGRPFTYQSNIVSTPVATIADLSIVKTASPDPVTAGSDLVYTLVVRNAGPSPASAVTITDALPAGVTFVSATPTAGSCSGSTTITCTAPTLDAGATMTVVITVTAAVSLDPSTVIANTASVGSTTADPNPANNTSGVGTRVRTEADLSITKRSDRDIVPAGEDVTYTIVATNDGPSDAADFAMADMLPPGLSYVSHTVSDGACVVNGDTIECAAAVLRAGSTIELTVVARTDPSRTGAITNDAKLGSSTFDPDLADNVASHTIDVVAVADIAVDKRADSEVRPS